MYAYDRQIYETTFGYHQTKGKVLLLQLTGPVSNHLTQGVVSLFAVCTLPLRVFKEPSVACGGNSGAQDHQEMGVKCLAVIGSSVQLFFDDLWISMLTSSSEGGVHVKSLNVWHNHTQRRNEPLPEFL